MGVIDRLKKQLDPIPPEHQRLAAGFDTESREKLRDIVSPVLMAGSVILVLFTLTDYLFYREVFWWLLLIRAMLVVLCWFAAALAWRRRWQSYIFRLALVIIALIALLLEVLLLINKDPTGPYLLAIMMVMVFTAVAHWPPIWMIRSNLITLAIYMVMTPLLGVVDDLPRFLFHCAALIGWTLLLPVVHVLLTRLRWESFLNRWRVETIAAENAQLYTAIKHSSQELERKVRERTVALQDAYDELERLDRSKSGFIQVVSHELRTPMTVFTGYSQMLLDDPTIRAHPTLALMVSNISSSSHRLSEIVNTMLDVVKIDSGGLQLDFGPVSLASVVQQVQHRYRDALVERDLTLEVDDLSTLPDIEGDSAELGKVFDSLLVNAIKYTPNGGQITIYGRIWPGGDDLPIEGVEIVVSDTGIGIATESRELIFSKFHQTGAVSLHSSGKTTFKGGGPGLGLAIARGIVEAHGGRLWVESPGYDEEACPGSQFHVVLPRQQ